MSVSRSPGLQRSGGQCRHCRVWCWLVANWNVTLQGPRIVVSVIASRDRCVVACPSCRHVSVISCAVHGVDV